MNNTDTYINTSKDKELELAAKVEAYREINGRLLNLFYTISHNLNSYTGNIKMILDIIDLDEDVAEQQEMLGHLRCVSNDLNETMDNLFKIAYVQNNVNVTREPLNLNQYLEKVKRNILGYKNENRLTFINNVNDSAFVNFNRAYLESVLLNFSTNAIKYAHPDRHPIVEFDFFMENGIKVLSIKDNGLGIDLERHGNSLFGLYKTFHNHEKAKGFGLYISKYQIEAMNGRVEVESEVGKGSTFKIYFKD